MTGFDLTGRLAVVTGVTGGLGSAIASALAASGADIVGVSTGRRPDGGIRQVIESHGRDFRAEIADLARRDSTRALVQRLGAGRPIDILVNNAGILHRSPVVAHADPAWDEVIETDLTAPFLLAREVGAGMVRRGAGKIVFIASMQSFHAGPDLVSYAAAKTGLVGLVRTLAAEWAASGVNVNAIAPGYFETDMTRPRREDPIAAAEVQARIPAGRWGRPEDIGGAAVFLASDAAAYVHGVTLPVDGGWLVR